MESLVVGLVLAFISALAWVAYKHPSGFRKLANLVVAFATLIIIIIGSYDYGIYRALVAISDNNFPNKPDILKIIKPELFTSWYIPLSYIALLAYLSFLIWLPDILEQEKKDRPKNP